MYNETYKVIRVVLIANQSMRPPIHRDVMCNTNIYKYETSNGCHSFSLLDDVASISFQRELIYQPNSSILMFWPPHLHTK